MKTIRALFLILFFTYTATGQDWKWINPSPVGNQLNSVKYIDASTALAVGNKGTILKTTNDGQNWSILNSNTYSNLISISVIDQDTIYVSGKDLSVFKTTDGGNTWKGIREDLLGNRNVSQVVFVTPAIGYLLGDGLEIYKTTDYGKTWIRMEVELNFQGVTSIYFTSADTGYATLWSNGILKTTDGGLTWKTITVPQLGPFNAIDFTNDSTAYLVGMLGEILKTTDAGENWQIQNNTPIVLSNSNLVSVDFIDENTGFVVGGRDILKTTDGGQHWEMAAQSTFDLHAVSFRDSLNGICAGGDWLHEYSCITTTSDGGKTWNESSSTVTNRYIDKVRFVNLTTGYAVGGNTDTFGGFILKTTNAGESWSTVNTKMQNYRMSDLSLPDENIIYTVGESGQVLKSDDAGASWLELSTNTRENLHAVSFLNATTGYVTGSNGVILKTTDGGETWNKQVSPIDKDLYSVYFKDTNTGYIVTYDWSIDSCTVLLTTTDGGLNWKKRSIGRISYPTKLVFVNQDTAFIAGSFGSILKTTDGGKHWTESWHQGNDYMDLFFTTENNGYAIGADGEISMTENCGKDWTALNTGTDKDLRSIWFTDVNTGFAVGSNGIILKTTNSGSGLKALRQSFYDLCPGDTAVLQPNFIGGAKPLTYTWDHSETTPTITVAPESRTYYQVTIMDQEKDTIQIKLMVDAYWVPTPVISQRGDTLISSESYGNNWYRNDTLVTDAFTDTLVAKISGNYYSIVHDYGCYSEKSNVVHLITGISDQTCDDDLTVYPNPATTQITVGFFRNNTPSDLTLLDEKGKLIRKLKTSGNPTQFNIGDLPSGIYFIQMTLEDRVITRKLVKKQ